MKRLLAAALAFAAIGLPAGRALAKGLISGTYTLTWSQDVQKTTDEKDTRTIKHTLDTKYSGFLSPVIENEITLKVEYEKGSDKESEIRVFPTVKLDYKGSYWNAGSKRTIERKPNVNQKLTDSYYLEFFYEPARLGMPDLKGKYTADFDQQAATTDSLKQSFTISSAYRPQDWLDVKGEYQWNSDEERLAKVPPDPNATPLILDDKYSFTIGIRHFVSDKLKFNTEWKSEFSRAASYFDNNAAKSDSIKEDQAHTWKNTLAFRPFRDTQLDASVDYDLKQTMVAKQNPDQTSQQDHTITVNSKVGVTQKIGTVIDAKGEFTRVQTDVRHTLTPSAKVDDGWNAELKADFAKQLVLNFKYTSHVIRETFGDPTKVPAETGSVVRSAGWTGELLPVWKASATVDRTDTYNFSFPDRGGRYLATIETKYALKGPFDFKRIDLVVEPTYDITIKDDFTKADPELQEKLGTRDFKLKVAKKVLTTRNVEVKVDHTYGRKAESGHLDPALNNVMRTDTSTGNIAVKDVLPNLNMAFDFTRSATDTSGDADEADVTENFGLKADYKYERLAWNAGFKYDRNLRSDKDNKWTIDSKVTWTAPAWDASVSYTQSKALSILRDESYKVSVDFKYNF